MRTALVHDWLTGMRGGEKALLAIAELFPSADIFTLIYKSGSCGEIVKGRWLTTSWLNRLPGVTRYYRHLLPLMPLAIRGLDLRGYDLVISSSHCVAKGVRTEGHAFHVCYCYTPMRYAWTQAAEYSRRLGPISRLALRLLLKPLRAWDVRSSRGVDLFLAISRAVADRIKHAYGRPSTVVWPPVDTDYFFPSPPPEGGAREDFFLVVSALAPYKCIDHAVEAFARLKRPLRVIGSGQMFRSLRGSAPDNVRFLGWQSDEVIREHYRRCRALIFPGEEDFGIVPLEATACGTPVIAYGAGGVLETIVDIESGDGKAPTGLLYRPHTVEALMDAVERFEKVRGRFDPLQSALWARRFGIESFRQRFMASIEPELRKRGRNISA